MSQFVEFVVREGDAPAWSVFGAFVNLDLVTTATPIDEEWMRLVFLDGSKVAARIDDLDFRMKFAAE